MVPGIKFWCCGKVILYGMSSSFLSCGEKKGTVLKIKKHAFQDFRQLFSIRCNIELLPADLDLGPLGAYKI